MSGLLAITGTDTGVGKTRVTRGVLRSMQHAGERPFPLKLVETGCARIEGELVPDDGLALARAARWEGPIDRVVPFRFALPASPLTAARAEGTALSFDTLVDAVRAAPPAGMRTVLEGAGGWLVPFSTDGTFGDLCAALGASVVLVARDALGTLNHTLLTVEAIRSRGVHLAAIVLNGTREGAGGLDHVAELRHLVRGVPIVGPLAWLPGADDDTLAATVETVGLMRALRG